MGGDGGSVPKRSDRVKSFVHPRKIVDVTDPNDKWKLCPISNYFIRKPVMAGHYGHLMSKEGVLEFLIKLRRDDLGAYYIREDAAPVCDTLHNMKDVKELKLKDNPALDKNNPAEDEWKKGDFVCPITGLETNGKYKFVFSWRCGCVISERALKECTTPEEKDSMAKKKCLICEKSYSPWDIVVINPDSKDFEENQARFLARKMIPMIKETTGLTNPSMVAGESSDELSSSQESNKSGQLSSAKSKSHHSSSSATKSREAEWDQPGPSTSRSRPHDSHESSHAKRDRSKTPQHAASSSKSPKRKK